MFKVVNFDVFSADIDVLIQGCNAFTTMGSGIARIIRDEYPGAWKADQNTIPGDRNKMGTYTFWTGPHFRFPEKTITICNAYTQYEFGRDKIHADYVAIQKVMVQISKDFADKKIGFPFIGAGLAGGDPDTILKIFVQVFKDSTVDATLFLRENEFPGTTRGIY